MNTRQKIDDFNFDVVWSHEHEEYMGLVKEFPSLYYLDHNKENALLGVRDLVKNLLNNDIQS